MQLVMVGSGYSGTANRVTWKVKDAECIVINAHPDFVERVRLHQQIAGTYPAATHTRRHHPAGHLAGRSAAALKEIGVHSAFSTARAGVSSF